MGSLLVRLDARNADPLRRNAADGPFIQSAKDIGGHTMQDNHEASAYWALRIALGVVPILAGCDKFTNLLVDWERYLSPLAVRLLPVSPAVFMRAAGVIEVVVGVGILFGYARVFGWIAMAWLAAIALDLVTTGHYLDVAARDLVMATGAYALARLAPAREASRSDAREDRSRPAGAHA
jgi:uncharacterized membrane protein YphA (DoxX/SURF4 family)